ncbi:Reticulon domain-containing protein [Cephalotus follicularis]|uniref:Reticulon-like protein n=1 Tax=Cephalotus follicularis TaxID=3775 RepID=A0A1Q3C1B2_CEPFO|nr:Reticulon domain-containing protein [Cephalotus follicularis]
MDSTPPPPPSNRSNTPHSHTKSASRLKTEKLPQFSLDLIIASPPPKKTPPSSSPLSHKSPNSLPLRELLLLSPSPLRRSRTRIADRLEVAEDGFIEQTGPRRKRRSKGSQMGCPSPRNTRRLRRRSETEVREERDLGLVEESGKARKRRLSGRSKKEKLSLMPCVHAPISPTTPKIDDGQGNLDQIGQMISDLVMWRDIAKSSLWFGFGCLCFLSSCFAKGINFSIFSAISQLGLLFLGASFFSNSIIKRNNKEKRLEFKLVEDDILRIGRIILPATNLAISKTRQLFSGEPSMTLKVVPFLLLGAEYGHLLTIRRLCVIGFLISFTVPKLYSCYSSQIYKKIDSRRRWVLEAWGACSHKKIVATSAVTAYWNLSSVKTRIFTAFIALVIIRHCRQHLVPKAENGTAEEEQEHQHPQVQTALVVAVAEGSREL